MSLRTRISAALLAVLLCAAIAAPQTYAAEDDGLLSFGAEYDYLVDALENAVPAYNETLKMDRVVAIDVSSFGMTVAQTKEICLSVYYHNPQLFFWNGEYTYSYRGDTVRTIYAVCNCKEEELEDQKREFNDLANALYELCPPDLSPVEIALFYHDHFASNYQYDTSSPGISDALDFLRQKKGVCQAYTAAFMLAMTHFGIPCTYARSDELNHIWNVVCIDGNWYHLDVTHDDPLIDRPGQARHLWFLTGSETTAAADNGKKNVSDIEIGADIAVSAADHPLRALLTSSTSNVPTVAVEGKLYSILVRNGDANLVQMLPAENSYRNLLSLPSTWRMPGLSSVIVGNFSGVASDGKYLYYFDDSRIYAYDPFTDDVIPVWTCPESVVLCGVQYSDGALTAYTSSKPSALPYTPVAINDPLPQPHYFTVTWVVGDQTFQSLAREGTDPLDSFNGSLEFEGEEGVEYFFERWSPELAPVETDVTYEAIFVTRINYLPGDLNNDGGLSIDDVSALLDLLSAGGDFAPAADLDGNGALSIDDVSALLDLLAA